MTKKARSTTAGQRAQRREEPAGATVPEPRDQATPTAAETTALPIEAAEPDPHATAWTELDLRCPTCRIVHYVPICIFLNARESPHLVQRVVKGHFNLKRCPVCRKVEPVDYPWTFYDPDRKLAVQVRSEWEYHAGGGEEWYAARLEDFFDKWADYDVRIDVVFSQQALVERFLQDLPAPPAR
ncbi:MAG TPA: CpXC domain-containing protein [Thermomicrobiales bacterium]|nr:CpXC domain-containing protein [Thermomicrobiales bacterium]